MTLACTRRAPLSTLLRELLALQRLEIDDDLLELAALAFVADDELPSEDRDAMLELMRAHANVQPALAAALRSLDDDA